MTLGGSIIREHRCTRCRHVFPTEQAVPDPGRMEELLEAAETLPWTGSRRTPGDAA